MATVHGTPKPAPADRREYHPLDQLRGVIRRYVVYEGLLSVLIFLAAWFALVLVLDYGVFKAFTWDWVQDGGKWIRGVALGVALILLAGIVVFRIVRRLRTEFSYPALALVLERRFPKLLGDRLITAVELADVDQAARHGYSAEMVRATIADARERVAELDARVHEVFNWRRLWVMAAVAAGIVLAALVVAYASYAVAARSLNVAKAGWKFYHVSTIAAERDLMLRDTPWPRRALLRLEGVSDAGLRIPQNKPVAAVRVRSFNFVIADRNEPDGWRPLMWSDVTESFVGSPVPDLPFAALALPGEAVALSTDPNQWTVDAVWERARDSAAVRDRLNQPTAMGVENYEALQKVFDRLREMADDPSQARTIRYLDTPAEVSFQYAGQRTAGTGPLTAEGTGVYTGTIGGTDEKTKLKEDVQYLVKAEDYRTPPRGITLVPAPVLTRFTRTDYQPAYLHYAPPYVADPAWQARQGQRNAQLARALGFPLAFGDAAAVASGVVDSAREMLADPEPAQTFIGGYAELRGLRQRMPDEKVPLVGDNSVVVVPAGTELVLTGTTELPIAKAEVVPDTGTVPGAKPGTQDPVPLDVRGGNTFEIAFRGNYRIRSQVKFKLRLENADKIVTERTIVVQMTNDTEPVVEVAPEAIRRVGNVFFVTTKARIPFNPESYLRDDNGLSKVAFTANYWPDDANTVQALRAGQLARDLLIPLANRDVTAAGRELARYVGAVTSDTANARREASFPLAQFVAADRALLPRETKRRILGLLPEPFAAERPDLVKKITLKTEIVRDEEWGDPFKVKVRQPDGTEADREFRYLKKLSRRVDGDYFDVGVLGLEVPFGDVQPEYSLDLNVQATDTNFDTGPGVARQRDPLKIKVVSTGTLLVKIGEEQGTLGVKLDEALEKLAKARAKYEFVNSRNGFVPLDQLNAVQVRSKDAGQDLTKAREVVQVVAREFRRIERECVINYLDEKNVETNAKLANRMARLLGESPPAASVDENRQVVDEDVRIATGQKEARPGFPRAEELMAAGQAALDQGRWADPATVTNALIEINRVEAELTDIRKSLGGNLTKEYLRELAKTLLDKQELIGQAIKRADIAAQEERTKPTPLIVPIGQVFLAKGETRKFKHAIIWRQYKEDDLLVKVAASDAAALTVPAELKLNFEKNDRDFEYEVRAGNKEGDYTITLTPAAGDKVEVKVTVK